MPEIRIYGASDDLVTIEGGKGADEFGTYGQSGTWGVDLVAPGGASLHVYVQLDHSSGCWTVGAGQPDEAIPIPDWPIRICQHPEVGYSALLVIDAPEGTRLDNIWPAQGGEDHG